MARTFAKPFYNSKRWDTVRAYVLIRDKYLCQRCGSTGHLEVHHKVHLTEENINDASISLNPDNLITLCRDCHFKQHEEDKANGNKSRSNAIDCDSNYYFDEQGFLVERKNI